MYQNNSLPISTSTLGKNLPNGKSDLHREFYSSSTKDLLYAQNEASQCNVDLKTAEAARNLFEAAVEQGLGDKDMASVIEPIRNK
jgi:3-hydroxyisobutyrate dehydrogenase-like beta-hydroxyacid dehydrogenase